MKRVIWGISCLLLTGWILVGAAPPERSETVRGQRKPMAPADIDYQTYIDANRILMFVTNQGSFAYDNGAMFGRADGLYYPKGTDLTAVYAAGLWLGAKAGGDLRVSLGEYSHTYWPGQMVGGTFIPNANSDPAQRVYKIYKHLAVDGFYDRPAPGDPDSLRMWNDYHQWPVEWGAPVDAQGKPLFIGDQTLWGVYNDANPATHTNSSGSAEGLGVEVQQTAFAFDRADALGDCIIMRYLVINKGGEQLNDMFLSYWADPDLGALNDDFVGCDTALNIGYCYNATNGDNKYGSAPPAVGFSLIQGPSVPSPGDSAFFLGEWHPGYRNLPMTAFGKYINGTDPTSAIESYRYMKGLDRDGSLIIDPTTGLPTRYMLPGDPVTNTGWVDCCAGVTFTANVEVECLETARPGGVPLDPPWDVGCMWNSTSDFFISSDRGCDFNRFNWQRKILDGEAWEFRFTSVGSEYYDWNSDLKFSTKAPFEVWNIGVNTPDNQADDRRIQLTILDDDGSGNWSPGDRIYPFEREYAEPLPPIAEYTFPDDFHLGRVIFNNGAPQPGTVVRISVSYADTVWDTTSADRRCMLSCGPFEIAPGDTQEVVMAVIVGQGIDRLSSVQKLKETAALLPKILTPDFEICNCLNTGDLNDNGIAYEVADVVFMVNYLFCGGNAPPSDDDCPLVNRADFDCDGKTNLVDLVRTVYLVYRHPAPMPCDPCRR